MDAETRPNTAVMAHVGPRGATAADLRKALGWPWERLEAVLRGLLTSRVLVRRDGKYYDPAGLVPPSDPPEHSEARKSHYADRRKVMADRYEYALRFIEAGGTVEELAAELGVKRSTAVGLLSKARKYLEQRGRPKDRRYSRTWDDYSLERRQKAEAMYRTVLDMRKRGATYAQIRETCDIKSDKSAREWVLRARRWEAGGGR